MLIDTHAHLYWEDFKIDLDQVLTNSKESGVEVIVNVGVDLKTSELAAKFETPILQTFSTIGIHPHEAHHYIENTNESIQQDMNKLEAIYLSNPDKVKAVGECGLDFFFEGNRDYTPSGISIDNLKNLQIKLLEAHVKLAQKLNLPLVIHCREAWKEIFPILENTRGIFHCYSGDNEDTQKALSTNYLISFAANITYPKNEYLREAAKSIPLDRIVLETDCPFLAPQSRRGKRNDPSSVLEIAQLISEIKNISIDEVSSQTTSNAKTVFSI